MDKEILNNIWSQLTAENLTDSSFEEWSDNIQNDSDVQENVHEYLVDNDFTDSNLDVWLTNTGLKKKEEDFTGEQELMEPTLVGGSSGSPVLTRNQSLGSGGAVGEKDTALERTFGKNAVTDFFGDLWRSGVQGQAQGATVDDALNLFAQGQNVSEEDLSDYISAVENMNTQGASDEMRDFTRIYEAEGKDFIGFLKGVSSNLSVIPQLFVSSMSSMINKGSLAAGATGAAGGALIGGGLPGGVIGGIAGLSGALETGLSYTEFLQEQLDKKGLTFDEEGIKEVLQDERAMRSIRNRAVGRGLTIAAVDAFSGGLAATVTRRAALKTGKALAGAAGIGVEAIGGGVGETAARVIADQEMDVAEIGFETVTGTTTAPLTVGLGLRKGKYTVNKENRSREDVVDFIETAEDVDIITADLTFKNDPDLQKAFQARQIKSRDKIKITEEVEQANPNISEEDGKRLIELETQRKSLLENTTKSSKNALDVIDKEIDEISQRVNQPKGKLTTTPDGKQSFEGTIQEAPGETNTENDAFVEQTITVEEVPNIYGPEVVTHKTRSRAAIENWVNGGQIVGRVENLDGFVEGTSSNKSNFQINRDNRQTPNFQQGGIYGNTVKKIEGGYVIISKPGTVDAKNFQPNLNFVNKESSKDSKGVLLPKPNTPARDISNYDIYKVVDGKMIKQNPNNFKTNTDAVQEVKSEEQNEGQPEGELTTTPDGKQSFEGTIQEAPGFITKPSIKEPFILRGLKGGMTSTQINFNEEGKIESVVNKKTGKPVSEKARKRAEKEYLESIIDVNEGQRSQLEEGINPSEINQAIADASNNPKEVAEAIVNEEQLIKEESSEKKTLFDDDKLNPLIGVKFTPESWREVTGLDPSDFGLTKTWISKDGVSLKDGWKDYVGEENVTLEEVVEFMKNNPNAEALNILGGKKVIDKNTLTSLKEKFKKLTGVEATPTNIDTVINIDPNREPLIVAKEQAEVQDQREAAESGVFGKKKGPTTKSVTEGKPKKVTVDESKALRDQIKLEVKAARESKANQRNKIRSLSRAISSLEKIGKINLDKAKQLIKQVSEVNLDNSLNVARVLNYVENVFNKADYQKKSEDANSLRKLIKKLSKDKDFDAAVAKDVKEFLRVDPLLVNDIDVYLEQANKVKEGITKGKINKDGSVSSQAVDVEEMNRYSEKEISAQEDIQVEAESAAFEELTGISRDDLSLVEMREIVNGIEGQEISDVQKNLELKANAKASVIKTGLEKAFKSFSSVVNSLISTDTDPFTGESIQISKEDKELIKGLLKIDINKVKKPADALMILDALTNFATNRTVGGVGSIIEKYVGNDNASKAREELPAAKPLVAVTGKLSTGIFKSWNKWISSLPLTIATMFKGNSRAILFDKLSGFSEIKRGFSDTVKQVKVISEAYSKEFYSKTANDQAFNTAYNDIERGMFAFMRRTISGEEAFEFQRRKVLIEESIDLLINQEGKYKKRGEEYKKVYDNILSDSNDITDVQSKVDPLNIEAVEWITKEWSSRFDQLSRTNLVMYNKILGKDINYTPDSLTLIEMGEDNLAAIGDPIFDTGSQRVVNKKTGVLMDVTRPSKLPKSRIVNLGFDSQNILNLNKAIADYSTAPAIQRIKAFTTSEDFKKLVPNTEDRALLVERIAQYIEVKRGRSYASNSQQKLLKTLNSYAGFGVSRTIGGITQPVKQILPVLVNTIINAGLKHSGVISQIPFNVDMNEWIDNSGYSVANRGSQSLINIENNDTTIKRAAEGVLGKAGRALNDVQKFWLTKFLAKPDAFAARASFIMYYLKALDKSTDINTSNIDWSSHDINTEAADYAQQQVDRQQNVSDTDLQGKLFTSKDISVQILRKAIFPFSNFLFNQKARMYSDVTILSSKTAEQEDKNAAAVSLAGLAAETVVFNSLGLFITQSLSALSAEDDDKRRDKKKKLDNRLKGRAGQAVKDILSPLPIAQVDGLVTGGLNAMISLASKSKDPFQFFEEQPEGAWERIGLISIPLEKRKTWNEMRKMAINGEYEQKGPFGKRSTRKLSKRGKEDMMANWMAYNLYALGLLPSEAGTIINYNSKYIKKKFTRR